MLGFAIEAMDRQGLRRWTDRRLSGLVTPSDVMRYLETGGSAGAHGAMLWNHQQNRYTALLWLASVCVGDDAPASKFRELADQVVAVADSSSRECGDEWQAHIRRWMDSGIGILA